MATLPTPGENARAILDIFKHFNTRPDESLRINNFLAIWVKKGFRGADFDSGMTYAKQNGWVVEIQPNEVYKLTEIGFAEA